MSDWQPFNLDDMRPMSDGPGLGAEWQPISTAPKDGTPLLLFARAFHATASIIIVGWWLPVPYEHWVEASFTDPVGVIPSHWMPLPERPSTTPADR